MFTRFQKTATLLPLKRRTLQRSFHIAEYFPKVKDSQPERGDLMARLTNEKIRNMSLNEADVYTDEHPAEAWRFAKAHGRSAIKQTKKAASHGFKTEKLFAEPETAKAF